ncbi:flocculation protein FLO11-like [Melanotaenia boesemani]|uniref:flocculation protein FLO11-like n=1 Tax=Melanotaenia boesemani TaxID=1250792 RepID=UPI001C045609|nr:flocculation protein FLO11-like [Melanotaenia boesemani]
METLLAFCLALMFSSSVLSTTLAQVGTDVPSGSSDATTSPVVVPPGPTDALPVTPGPATTPTTDNTTATVTMTTTTPDLTTPYSDGPSHGTTVSTAATATASYSSAPASSGKSDTSLNPMSSPTSSPGTSQTTTLPAAPNCLGVPGWGIALLVLAAVALLLLLLLLVGLLVWLCCRRCKKGFSPYENPAYRDDIPLYTTHSRFDGVNGKPIRIDLLNLCLAADLKKPLTEHCCFLTVF